MDPKLTAALVDLQQRVFDFQALIDKNERRIMELLAQPRVKRALVDQYTMQNVRYYGVKSGYQQAINYISKVME